MGKHFQQVSHNRYSRACAIPPTPSLDQVLRAFEWKRTAHADLYDAFDRGVSSDMLKTQVDGLRHHYVCAIQYDLNPVSTYQEAYD